MEAKHLFIGVTECCPIVSRGFQQGIGADNVGFHEGGRAIDGAIHMAFCSQMHHRIRLMLRKHGVQSGSIANIHLLKSITGAIADAVQAFQVARIGELVNVDDAVTGVVDDVANNC